MKYFQNNKKTLLLFLFFLGLSLASGIYLRKNPENTAVNNGNNPANQPINPTPSFSSISLIPIKEKNLIALTPSTANTTPLPSTNATKSPEPPVASKISISPTTNDQPHILYVGDKRHEISIPEQSTVYNLMISLKQRGDLDFKGKDSSGLGFFVEEINGIKNNIKENTFWIYYVNGKTANVGVSYYILKTNDIINWKYEKPQF